MKKYWLVLMILCFFLFEIVLRLSPVWGFICYSVLITVCLISLEKDDSLDDRGKLMIVLMIIPIMRIAELFINLDYVWRNFVVYFILLFLVFFYSMKFELSPGYLRKKGFGWLPLVILLGGVLGIIGNSLLNLNMNIKYFEFLFLLPVIALSEEFLFRGLIQNLMNKDFGAFFSVLFTSLIYGVSSIGLGIPFALFFLGVSLITGLIYHRTKNVYLAIAINLTVHFFILILPKISF
jgi:membrane protease YdiL (CAAX protease family)